jgi:hypothetical protein
MPNLFHFAKGLPVQLAGIAYGANTTNKFRVTSSFQMAGTETAYAMLSGTILLQQQQADASKVNLILKPNNLSAIKMPVKYIIYRGLKTASFLTGTDLSNTDTKVCTEGSELISKMWAIQQGRDSNAGIPLQALFGYTLNPGNDIDIDDFFHHSDNNTSSQLFSVPGGIELGTFKQCEINEINGIEIMLENPDLKFTVAIAKKSINEIDVTAISNEVEKKWKREQIRHFVDPAAFYGLHSDIKGGIEYRVDNKPAEGWPRASSVKDVYEQIIDKFDTKNNIYLDIRNENGYSYDYYSPNNKNIYININGSTYITVAYCAWNEWPIFRVNSLVSNLKLSTSPFYLELENYVGLSPVIIGQYATEMQRTGDDGYPTKALKIKNKFFINNLGSQDNTSELTISIPSYITIENNENKINNISTIIRLDYIRKPGISNNSFFYQKSPIDFIFGPIDTKIQWQGNAPIKWMSSYIDRYFYDDNTVAALQSGMAEETLNEQKYFTYYAASTVCFKSNQIIKDTYAINFNGGTVHTNVKNFLTYFNAKLDAGIQKDGNILHYQDTKKGNTFLLGITKDEKNRLFLLDPLDDNSPKVFADYHHVFFKLVPTFNQNEFNLVTVGVTVNNNILQLKEYDPSLLSPSAPVHVYSLDNKIFTSAGYQNAVDFKAQQGIIVHFRRTREYKNSNLFHFGFDWMRDGKHDNYCKEKPYIQTINQDGLCEKANIDGNHIGNKTDAQNYLKYEYTPEIINGQTYYVPWLNMYKNHSNEVSGLTNDDKQGHVKLQLYIENGKDNDIITFVPPEGINVTINNSLPDNPLQVKVKDLKYITIECTAESSQDRIIEVLDSKDLLIGKLNIFKNEKTIERKVCFINLILNGYLPLSTSKIANFTEDKIYPDSTKSKYSSIANFKNNWISYLRNDQNNSYTKKFLHQALAKYSPENVNNDGTINSNSHIKINFGNSSGEINQNNSNVEINGNQLNSSQIFNYINNFLQKINDVSSENNYPVVTFNCTANDFATAFNDLFNAINGNLLENFTDFVFLPGFCCKFTNENPAAFSNYEGLIFLCGSPALVQTELIAHEIAHNMKLLHSFEDNEQDNLKKFIFKKYDTENIMDYVKNTVNNGTELGQDSVAKVSFWKWQWEKILDKND